MQKYLEQVVEWAARRILSRAVMRTSEMLDEMDEVFEYTPKALPKPQLPEIEYRT